MNYQPDLYNPACKRSRHTQGDLFGRTVAEVPEAPPCPTCGRLLIVTDSHYSCPMGHGKLIDPTLTKGDQ